MYNSNGVSVQYQCTNTEETGTCKLKHINYIEDVEVRKKKLLTQVMQHVDVIWRNKTQAATFVTEPFFWGNQLKKIAKKICKQMKQNENRPGMRAITASDNPAMSFHGSVVKEFLVVKLRKKNYWQWWTMMVVMD